MAMTYYGYPKCGTCRKAKKWLENSGIEFEDINIAENPPSKEELQQMISNSDLDIKKFFNVSGMKYRELNLKDKLPGMTDDEKIELLATDGMLIKRPIVTDGSKVTVGFKEDAVSKKYGEPNILSLYHLNRSKMNGNLIFDTENRHKCCNFNVYGDFSIVITAYYFIFFVFFKTFSFLFE